MVGIVHRILVQTVHVAFILCLFTLQTAKGQVIAPDLEFERMLDKLLRLDVQTLKPEDLSLIKGAVCLDAREREEYDVSHIPGARWVGYDDFSPERLKGLDPASVIVVYCSVGYRSEQISRKLNSLGYNQVYNLYGGIFGWVNEGNPVVNNQGVTEDVHVFSRKWSRWLRRGNPRY